VVETPCLRSAGLSEMTGAEIHVKLESFQTTSSFKDRGALNKLLHLTDAERRRGVVAMSAGNHAQAVAFRARELGIAATIVMPETTPSTKIERTRAHGAEIILSGETLADSQIEAERLVTDQGLVLIHPYDDDLIVAGQGTVGIEMLAAWPELDCLVVPIGGGGIISGVAVAAKHIRPGIEIVGVEAERYPSMTNALRGEPPASGGSTLAEGIAVKNVTERTIEICRQLVADVVLVGEPALERAVMAYLTTQRVVAEGAGAASLAAVLADPGRYRGRKVGLVLSGGNIDARILASIVHRELEREQRIVRLHLRIEDRPGAMGRIATLIGEHGANILQIFHHRTFLDIPAKGADLEILMETNGSRHVEQMVAAMTQAGFQVQQAEAGYDRRTLSEPA
jgi:threonine dehydratase